MKKQLLKTMLLLCALVAGSSNVWADDITYTFTSRAWAATVNDEAANWTSGQDGGQLTAGRGVQVTAGASGANATSPTSLSNISKIVVTYSTNASKGAGSIAFQVGNGTAKSQNVTTTGGTDDRTLTYNFSPEETGNVKITVTCTTNSIYVKSVTVTYTPDGGGSSDPVDVTGVSLNKTATTLTVGDKETLTATIAPANATNKDVIWVSDNDAVATVDDNGLVTAVAPGTATITVVTDYGEFEAECVVTVEAAPIVAATLDFTADGWGFPTNYEKEAKTYTYGGYSVTFGASSNGHKVMTSSGNVTAVIFGRENATLSLPAFDFNVSKIKVYGNTGASGKVTFNVFVDGAAVSTEVTSAVVNHDFVIDADKQAAGTIYTIKLTNDNNCQISKIEIFGYVPVTISDAEYATLVAPAALDFSESGIKAYTVKANTTSVTLNEVANGQVPAGAAVVLYKAGGATVNVPVIAEAAALADNDLVAGPVTGDGESYYVLGKDGDKVGFGLLKSGVGLSANKAYIPVSKFGAAAPSFVPFSVGETTAIRGIESGELRMENFFDLQGRRVAQPTKGLFLVNGRKVVIK